jgi:1,4-alpha-glucan branching enzyme
MASYANSTNTHPKLYKIRGAQYCKDNGLTTFRVYAPNARAVWVSLTAYGREEIRLKMQKNIEGIWETVSNQAPPGRTYLYLVDDYNGKRMLRMDPVSFSVIDITEVQQVQSVVYDPTVYQWGDQNWMMKRALTDPLRSPLSIYEMQPKSWKSGVYQPINYRQIAPELAIYCQRMGFTHVEVFGLMEHSRKTERGYQVSNFFAPYHDNGQCDDLKYFVDHLHQHNIGVIIDWVPTHYHHYHASHSFSASLHEFDGTNLHASHASRWGTLYFDFSKEETYRLLFASALYFLDEIHLDGIRFDAVSQMIRRESNDIVTAIGFLRELNATIHRCYPGVLSIAEETEGYPRLCKTMGFDLKWNIGWCHDAMNLLRTPYHERSNHWQEKVLNMLYSAQGNDDKMILTLSHDDTDCHFYDHDKSLYSCVPHAKTELARFSDLRNFFAWQTFGPSRGHMIHMGDEVAQPISWFHRFRNGLSSMDWSLSDSSTPHGKTQEYIADLNKLYCHHPQFWQNGEQDFAMIYEFKSNLIVAYHRGIYANRRMAILHNFSNKGYQSYDIYLPRWDHNVARIRKIIEIFNSDNPIYGGSGLFQNEEIKLIHHHGKETLFKLAIPPLATLVLEEHLY